VHAGRGTLKGGPTSGRGGGGGWVKAKKPRLNRAVEGRRGAGGNEGKKRTVEGVGQGGVARERDTDRPEKTRGGQQQTDPLRSKQKKGNRRKPRHQRKGEKRGARGGASGSARHQTKKKTTTRRKTLNSRSKGEKVKCFTEGPYGRE